MAGHSHWAGIKHKKGKADKLRSKIFSKLSKEITVAAKLGDKDPSMNPRLRSAIQAARSANMPKDNIERAIDKSSLSIELNFESLRYEGFGPEKIAVIQKAGGNLGTLGSASHNFNQLGIIKIATKEISEDRIFELAIEAGANECKSNSDFHEIQCSINDIYKVKKELVKEITNFISTGLEWIPLNKIKIPKEKNEELSNFFMSLEDDDDVQNVYSNVEFRN